MYTINLSKSAGSVRKIWRAPVNVTQRTSAESMFHVLRSHPLLNRVVWYCAWSFQKKRATQPTCCSNQGQIRINLLLFLLLFVGTFAQVHHHIKQSWLRQVSTNSLGSGNSVSQVEIGSRSVHWILNHHFITPLIIQNDKLFFLSTAYDTPQ